MDPQRVSRRLHSINNTTHICVHLFLYFYVDLYFHLYLYLYFHSSIKCFSFWWIPNRSAAGYILWKIQYIFVCIWLCTFMFICICICIYNSMCTTQASNVEGKKVVRKDIFMKFAVCCLQIVARKITFVHFYLYLCFQFFLMQICVSRLQWGVSGTHYHILFDSVVVSIFVFVFLFVFLFVFVLGKLFDLCCSANVVW